MTDANAIREHMEVIGADGVHVGTVDCVKGDRIVLSKSDSTAQMEQGGVGEQSQQQMEQAAGMPEPRHHYIPLGLVAEVEGNRVRLSATGANAVLFEEDKAQG
jgi:hypothetical protein